MTAAEVTHREHVMSLGELLIDFERPPSEAIGPTGRWFALVDLSVFTSLEDAKTSIDSITAHGTSWINLYADMDGLELAAQGPHLVSLLDDRSAYQGFSLTVQLSRGVSFIQIDNMSRSMTKHLLALREMTLPDGSEALFRFQDPRVIAALRPVLDDAQRAALLGPIHRWVCTDPYGIRHEIVRPENAGESERKLRLYAGQMIALDEALLPYEVLAQTREADGGALIQMRESQQLTAARAHIEQARAYGLKAQGDLSLYCVLAFQLPAGFADEPPFSEAIAATRSGKKSFAQALDLADPRNWERWNDMLARQDGMKN